MRVREKEAEVKDSKEEQEKKKKKKKKKRTKVDKQVLVNALFANAGSARRIAFAIDISGSMTCQESSFGGSSRIDVVKQHLEVCALRRSSGRSALLTPHIAADGAAVHGRREEGGIWNRAVRYELPYADGHRPDPCHIVRRFGASRHCAGASGGLSAAQVGLDCVRNLRARGGNGGEAACLNACLAMGPEAVFFLGDGGWDSGALIAAAAGCGAVLHSIAFFTSGGGLREIASSTGGTYREVNGAADLAEEPGPRPRAAESSSGSETGSSGDESSGAEA